MKFSILEFIKFFLNSIYIYIFQRNEIIWNNKSFTADNNNDKNQSNNISWIILL